MAKIALLIGVSEYELGLNPLPSAGVDAEAMARVLRDPEVGGFDQASLLANPSRQEMEEAIDDLFSKSQNNDLVLFYYSGHGIKDDNEEIYLATRNTRKDKDRFAKSTAVSARFIQEMMSNGRSRRQVVILDCDFSGTFGRDVKILPVRDDDHIDIRAQLGGVGRAILTSSSSTQYAFWQEESDLSLYTRYLVEGIATGAADLDSDGFIAVDELHEYVQAKVRAAAPAMTPMFYTAAEGYKILLAKVPVDNSKLRYRKELQRFASRDELSSVARRVLHVLKQQLGLSEAEAHAIEVEVLQPHREYRRKLQEYKEALLEVMQVENPISEGSLRDLKDYRQYLGLRDEDIAAIEAQVVAEQSASTQHSSLTVEASHDNLSSERGLDYTLLRDLLKAGRWKEADYETYKIILKLIGRRESDWVREEEIRQFPCLDLRTLDELWVKYSSGKFGFSIQKQIYLECGGKLDDNYDDSTYEKFGDRVGWRLKSIWIPYYDLIFDSSAPLGHLPRPGGWVRGVPSLFSRLEACRL